MFHKAVLSTALFGAALLWSGAVSAAPADNELSGVEVVADNTVVLRVAVSGDLGPKSVVVSDGVAGINCGPDAYKYTPHENRQCWVWVRRSEPVMLTAKGMIGAFGADWSVAWSGCQVLSDGAACRIDPRDETNVSAVFKGRPQ